MTCLELCLLGRVAEKIVTWPARKSTCPRLPDRMGPVFAKPCETQQNRVAGCFPSCDNHKMAWVGNHKSNPIPSFFSGGKGGGVCGRRIWVWNVKTLPGVVNQLEIEIGNQSS